MTYKVQQFINVFYLALGRGLKYLDMTIRGLMALSMALIMASVVFHVFGRYFVGKTYMGTMELVRYTMVWTSMLGAAAAFGAREHVSITFLKSRLSHASWVWLNFIGNALLCLFLVIMIIGGITISIRNLNQTSLGMQISMFYPYLAIPVGGVIIIPYVLSDMLSSLLSLFPESERRD